MIVSIPTSAPDLKYSKSTLYARERENARSLQLAQTNMHVNVRNHFVGTCLLLYVST